MNHRRSTTYLRERIEDIPIGIIIVHQYRNGLLVLVSEAIRQVRDKVRETGRAVCSSEMEVLFLCIELSIPIPSSELALHKEKEWIT